MRNSIINVLMTVCMTLFWAQASFAYYAPAPLPDPTIYPNAIRYDDFWSYSTKVMNAIYGGWDASAGSGGLDLLLYSGGSTPQPYDVEIPSAQFPPQVDYNPDPHTDGDQMFTWSVELYRLVDWMQSQFGANATLPIFTFDMDEAKSAAEQDLEINSFTTISKGGASSSYNPAGLEALWAFDPTPNSQYDPSSFVHVNGTLLVEYPLGSGDILPPGKKDGLENNDGSGKFDFIVYAPTMDLETFMNRPDYKDLWFNFSANVTMLSNGPEEITLTGRYAPHVVPEPSSLLLLFAGGLGWSLVARGRRKN